ncbi:MAG: phosphatidylglycerophosphatase A [Rhizomicrobium sp.]
MIATALSTVFGVGYARFAPGTAASLVALPFAWLILWELGPAALAVIAIGTYFVGVWTTDIHAARIGKIDPSECVIDEVAGQWLACAAAPLSLVGFALAFALFRALDISKLWPVSLGEKLPGGWGIMTDDLIAAVISAAVVAALRWRGLI